MQVEDVMLCEGVQRGLESPAYDIGRYAPTVENAMHHFRFLLHESLSKLCPDCIHPPILVLYLSSFMFYE